jgi:hypothetical protein
MHPLEIRRKLSATTESIVFKSQKVLLARLTSVCDNIAELILKMQDRASKENEKVFEDEEFNVETRSLTNELKKYHRMFKLNPSDF